MQKTTFLPGTATALTGPTHSTAPHSGLDYLVSEAALHLQGASMLKAPHAAVWVAEGISPKGATQGANKPAPCSSVGVTQPRCWSPRAPAHSPAIHTHCQGLLKRRCQTLHQCKPLRYWGEKGSTTSSTGTGHTAKAAASPDGMDSPDDAGVSRAQPG